MFKFEKEYLSKGCKYIAGVDEAGRGPLAGPVCCAAVIMPLSDNDIIDGVNDSKKLSAKRREFLYDRIVEKAVCYKVVLIDNKVIDEINILNATKKGMTEAICGLTTSPDIVLIDAVPLALEVETLPIIKGDAQSYSIAAASILAKVTRDRLMIEYSKRYPQYGFERHKGYGTRAHYAALRQYGVSDIHRNTFLKNGLDK